MEENEKKEEGNEKSFLSWTNNKTVPEHILLYELDHSCEPKSGNENWPIASSLFFCEIV